jgi:hypothetical protein
MWTASKQTLKFIAICSCCFVFFAATAHLVHHRPFNSPNRHGKTTLDVACSLCMFSVKATFQPVFVLPQQVTLVIRHLSQEGDDNSKPDGLLSLPVSRAPPFSTWK